MPADPRTNPVFDRLFAEAVPALFAGAHRQDEPPVDGGRWPVSVVAVPPAPVRDVLAGLMAEALVHAGPGHFETGRCDASHLTVRGSSPTARPRHRPTTSLAIGSPHWRRSAAHRAP